MITTELFPDYKRPSCRTGNVYISGLGHMGAEGCLLQLLKNTMEESAPIFYFDAHLSREKLEIVTGAGASKGYRILSLNNRTCTCISFDMLLLFETPEEKAEAIYAFLYDKKDSMDSVNQICRYLKDCIIGLEEKRERFTIKDILKLSIEEVRSNIASSKFLSEEEIADEISFLESRETYRNWGFINDRSKKLISCGIIDVFSGSIHPVEIIDGKVLFLISKLIDTTEAQRTFTYIQNGFLNILAKICEKWNYFHKLYHVFINNSSEIKMNQLVTVLNIGMNSSTPIPVCIYDQSITKILEIHTAEILDYFGAFCIFKTNDGVFWSDFFGTMLTPEYTETYTKKRSSIFINTGGVVPKRQTKYQATTVHRVEKPLYEPRVFQSLKEKTMMFYNIYTNRKTRKQLYW